LRLSRFHFESHKHQYLLTRAFERDILSNYLGVHPASLLYKKSQYGKPSLITGEKKININYNISHTEGLIVCAVALKYELGVDTEYIKRDFIITNIASHYFTSEENEDLTHYIGNAKKIRFLEYWTLKEAYIKAHGMGLSLPLDYFSIRLQKDAPIIIIFHDSIYNDGSFWQFFQVNQFPEHILAVAINQQEMHTMKLITRPWVPLSFIPEIKNKWIQ
jgi:4'-phosphopantetheinyl transferase